MQTYREAPKSIMQEIIDDQLPALDCQDADALDHSGERKDNEITKYSQIGEPMSLKSPSIALKPMGRGKKLGDEPTANSGSKSCDGLNRSVARCEGNCFGI